jgi:hypothetical protein
MKRNWLRTAHPRGPRKNPAAELVRDKSHSAQIPLLGIFYFGTFWRQASASSVHDVIAHLGRGSNATGRSVRKIRWKPDKQVAVVGLHPERGSWRRRNDIFFRNKIAGRACERRNFRHELVVAGQRLIWKLSRKGRVSGLDPDHIHKD